MANAAETNHQGLNAFAQINKINGASQKFDLFTANRNKICKLF